MQLGTWDHENVRFDQYGWVPEIGSPINLAKAVDDIAITQNEFKIGTIPNSNFPVILNKEFSLTHHTAVLGITGTGKSVFTRNLIREYLNDE